MEGRARPARTARRSRWSRPSCPRRSAAIADRAVQIHGAAGIAHGPADRADLPGRARRADLRRRQRGAPDDRSRASCSSSRMKGESTRQALRARCDGASTIAPDDIVRTPRGGRRPTSASRCWSLEPLLAFLDEHGLGRRRAGDRAARRRPLQRRPTRSRAATLERRAAPPAARRRSRPVRPRRAARGARAARARRAPAPRAAGPRRLRGRVRDRRAVLRHGDGRGPRLHDRESPPELDSARAAAPDRRRARRRARRDPRRRLAGRGAGGLRQADRLPRAPAPALPRACSGAQQDARDPGARTRRRSGCRRNIPQTPATTIVHGDYRLGNVDVRARRARRGWSPSSTGRWRRSATRSPTSATCSRCGPSAATRRWACSSSRPSRARHGFRAARSSSRATRSARGAR